MLWSKSFVGALLLFSMWIPIFAPTKDNFLTAQEVAELCCLLKINGDACKMAIVAEELQRWSAKQPECVVDYHAGVPTLINVNLFSLRYLQDFCRKHLNLDPQALAAFLEFADTLLHANF